MYAMYIVQKHPRRKVQLFIVPKFRWKNVFFKNENKDVCGWWACLEVLLCFWQVCKLSYTLLFVSNVTLATERGRERGRGIPHVLLPSNLILRQPLLSFQLFIFYSKHWHDYLICSIFKFLIIYYLKLSIVLEFKLRWKENC